jgi:hypothetical protein
MVLCLIALCICLLICALLCVTLGKQQTVTAKETYRAHIRIDNLHKIIKKLKKEIGWTDDNHKTKIMDKNDPYP